MTIPTIRSLRRNVTRNVPRVGSLLAIFSLGFSMSVPAQDLAEIARQQRAKRDAQPQHVYTNDDLKRDKILTPEDRQRAEADKAAAPGSSASQSAAAAPAPARPAPAPADVADAAPAHKSAAEESLGDFARRVIALKAQQDRIKKEREARLHNQLPLELPPPELMRPPALAYPMFPEPSVKAPLTPALVAPHKLSRSTKDVPAPAAPLSGPAARPETIRTLGGLAVPPPAPWAPLASAHPRPRLEVSAPPAVPSARLVAPQLAGDLASPPVAPVTVSVVPSSRPVRGVPAAPAVPATRLVAPQLAGNLAALPVAPVIASAVPSARPLRGVPAAPAVSATRLVAPQLPGNLAALPAAPVSASAAPSSRPLRGVPALPAVPSVRLAASAPAGELASLPAAPLAARAVSPSLSRRSRDIPSPPAIPLTRQVLTVPEGVLALPITPPARRRNRTANNAGDGVVPSDTKVRGSYKGVVRVIPVHPGDTLWQLSRKYLGRAQDWSVVAAANPQLADPTRLQAGTWIAIPETSAQAANAAGVRVQVQHGDSLSLLAREHLGASAAWLCVAEANPQVKNPNLIFVGQTVTIPESCTSAQAPAAAPVAALSTHSYLR